MLKETCSTIFNSYIQAKLRFKEEDFEDETDDGDQVYIFDLIVLIFHFIY